MRIFTFIMLVIAFMLFPQTGVSEQRGLGDSAGVAQSNLSPEIQNMSGTILEIQEEACEQTTGHSTKGTHLIVENEAGDEINLHLGPTKYISENVPTLKKGQNISVQAFHTADMPENAYVATALSVTTGQKTVLRDRETLRPLWAGNQGRGKGRRAQYNWNWQKGRGWCW